MSRKTHYLLAVLAVAALVALAVHLARPRALLGLLVCGLASSLLAYLVGYRVGRERRARSRARERRAGDAEQAKVDRFHSLYYDSGVFAKTSWLGVPTLKCPLDLWVYQEIMQEVRPEVIVECGTAHGGSALYLAWLCESLGKGEVITLDVEEKAGRPRHPRIAYLRGSSVAPEVVEQVKRALADRAPVMVLLDSDHSKDHVLAELRIYGELVTPGSYLIVEDTNLGHPVRPDFGPGPMEAVEEFLAERGDFARDRSREKFLLTFNPGGYLRKLS